jgi:predicted PurR-regulated permease PerM
MLAVAVAVYLLEKLFILTALFATPLLLFGLAWLVALMLKPLVDRITQWNLPVPFVSHRGASSGVVAPTWRLPRSAAVSMVYAGMIALVAFLVLALVPIIQPQLVGVEETLPGAVGEISNWIVSIENEIARLGFRGDIERIAQPEALAQQAATLGSTLVQQSLDIASRVFAILIDVVLVLILSFYMTLDGPRISGGILRTLPPSWRADTARFFGIVNHTFGGFLRAQVLQGSIYGLATAVVMTAFGLNFVALASVITAIIVLVPIIGGILGVIPPLLVVLIERPDRTLWMLLVLALIQQVLFNMIMPRLIGRSVGLHPLLVFAAILVGAAVAGGWGILFGIPIAGVVASVLQFIYGRATGEEPTIVTPPDPMAVVDVAHPPLDAPGGQPATNDRRSV